MVLSLDPASPLLAEARAAHGGGRLGEAEALYWKALQADPSRPEALCGLAQLALEVERPAEARRLAEAALKIDARSASALVLLGSAALRQGDAAAAVEVLRRAVSLAPRNGEAWAGLAGALADLGRWGEAAQAGRQARPDDADARFNLALALLASGRLEEGWRLYEDRFAARAMAASRREMPMPLWDGGSLEGRSLLVWGEQGPGDTILFGCYLPALLARGIAPILEVTPRLVPLFRRSFPGLMVVEKGSGVAADLHCPMGGLGLRLPLPEPAPYLRADPARTRQLRARYRSLGEGRLVGVAWGSRAPGIGDAKSVPLELWSPILQRPGCVFVSLQYGEPPPPGLPIHFDAEIDQLADMDGFAAQVAALDLVVSVSSAAVHVAGAQGVPCLAMIPKGRGEHWYWFQAARPSPWYPGLSLHRQERPGEWAPVVARVAAALG